ncbi:hypothetical protein LVD15_05545 [Fulvivirga maritima]|uniref:hypothetical protein n=1 Tax=Fulvivirga maritima TaxID=2904247 RepID=UPI001F37483A|nr:hypothetical protein [Fulvivirga maritima]UII27887.1 hypothetical protein LVD15_05545 [Fulvivirga maritima]
MKSGDIYEPKGKIGKNALLITVLLIVTIIPALAIAYAFATWYTPLIYANLIICVAFGVALGYLIFPIVKWGHVVGYKNELIFIAFIWAVAMYFQWAAYVTLAVNLDTEDNSTSFVFSDFLYFAAQPWHLVAVISEISKYGLWAIGSTTFKDFGLWVVWFAEALILIVTMIGVNQKWSTFPYSHTEANWIPKTLLKRRMPLNRGFSKFIEGLKNDTLEPFTELPYADPDSKVYTEIAIFTTKNDSQSFLAFYNKQLKTGKDGKKEEEYKRASDFYALSETQKAQLVEHYS